EEPDAELLLRPLPVELDAVAGREAPPEARIVGRRDRRWSGEKDGDEQRQHGDRRQTRNAEPFWRMRRGRAAASDGRAQIAAAKSRHAFSGARKEERCGRVALIARHPRLRGGIRTPCSPASS